MAKTPTKGTLVKHGTSASPSTNLANVRNVRMKPGLREMIKATCHDNTDTDEYLPRPLRDSADLEIDIAWDPDNAGHEAVRAAYVACTKYYFTKVHPNTGAAQWALGGYITSFTPGDADAETGLLTATIGYKADGPETFTQ